MNPVCYETANNIRSFSFKLTNCVPLKQQAEIRRILSGCLQCSDEISEFRRQLSPVLVAMAPPAMIPPR